MAFKGKYKVTRVSDGKEVEWPFFVLGARDPVAAYALRKYANQCYVLGMSDEYVDNVGELADEFEAYMAEYGEGDPDNPPD